MLPLLRRIILPGCKVTTVPPVTWIAGIPCLEILPSGYTKQDNIDTVVYLHGNAMDLSSSWRIAWQLANGAKMKIIVPEYRGYGVRLNEGETDPYGTVTDVQRVIRYLGKVHLIGYSIGTAVASQAAAGTQSHIQSLTLIAPFYSLKKMVNRVMGSWMTSLLLHNNDIFDTAKWIKKNNAPTIIFHGTNDIVCPFEDGKMLSDETKSLFVPLKDRGHQNISYLPICAWLLKCQADLLKNE